MIDLPEEAVEAVDGAYYNLSDSAIAKILRAAAPCIRKQERERVLARLRTKEAMSCLFGGEYDQDDIDVLTEAFEIWVGSDA